MSNEPGSQRQGEPGSRKKPNRKGRGFWDGYETALKRVEMLAKPVAFLLAALGLIGLYLPKARRAYEELITPVANYQVGIIRPNLDRSRIIMAEGSYDSPAWNNGLRAGPLFRLVGTDVLTTDTAVGREAYSLYSQVLAVQDKNQCLHVRDVAFSDYVPGGTVWPARPLGNIPPNLSADARLAALLAAARLRGAPDCQVGTEQEWRERVRKANGRAVDNPYVAGQPICPRVIVWIQAQKVSC